MAEILLLFFFHQHFFTITVIISPTASTSEGWRMNLSASISPEMCKSPSLLNSYVNGKAHRSSMTFLKRFPHRRHTRLKIRYLQKPSSRNNRRRVNSITRVTAPGFPRSSVAMGLHLASVRQHQAQYIHLPPPSRSIFFFFTKMIGTLLLCHSQ